MDPSRLDSDDWLDGTSVYLLTMRGRSPYARFSGAGTAFNYYEAVGFDRNPVMSTAVGPWSASAGPEGVAVGCFGWLDVENGQVSNAQANGDILVFVLPVANDYNLWERAYIRQTQMLPGSANAPAEWNGDKIYSQGTYVLSSGFVYYSRLSANSGNEPGTNPTWWGQQPFPQEVVRPNVRCGTVVAGVFSPKFPNGGVAGSRVYADPANGLPYASNPDGSLVATPYTLLQNGDSQCRLRMSSFIPPIN